MSILIKDMEMPTECLRCRFAADGWCYALEMPNIDALANDERAGFCPLVPVPPHGRLIDADDIDSIRVILREAGGAIKRIDAPTIIPASEEGE